MKTPAELEMVERDRMDLESILKLSNDNCRSLIGHSGSVFGVSISPRRDFLVSGGEDGTVRLWSLMVYQGVIVHRGHLWPVWDVHFGQEFLIKKAFKSLTMIVSPSISPLIVTQGIMSFRINPTLRSL